MQTFFVLQANDVIQDFFASDAPVQHHIDRDTLICIMFGNILLLQNMLMLRKAGPRMLSVII